MPGRLVRISDELEKLNISLEAWRDGCVIVFCDQFFDELLKRGHISIFGRTNIRFYYKSRMNQAVRGLGCSSGLWSIAHRRAYRPTKRPVRGMLFEDVN